jgi:DNA-directed RNA polymerase beta subunit
VSAALIPFLEHDDANRALMGSNMQRQAVPLLTTDPPVVATGMEREVAANSGMVVTAENDGVVNRVTSTEIVVDDTKYKLRKYVGLNERTCLNQRPIVAEGETVTRGQVIADGAATHQGELALGKNILVAFMPYDGHNFEDAIVVSEKLVKNDVYTSIHIDEFEVEIRETKLGREEFTRDIPNVSERALRNLNEEGIVRIGTRVSPGDILVGKVAPKSKSELSPEEKLLQAIFGRAGEDVRNDSLDVPSGVEGIVIDTQKFSRRTDVSEDERAATRSEIKKAEKNHQRKMARAVRELVQALEKATGGPLISAETGERVQVPDGAGSNELKEISEKISVNNLKIRGAKQRDEAIAIVREKQDEIEEIDEQKNKIVGKLTHGEGLRRHQARAVGRRQDGRPPRQQGRRLEDRPRRGHAVPRRRDADRHDAQPARRAEPHERRPDPRDAPGLGRQEAQLPGRHPGVRWSDRGGDRGSAARGGPARRGQGRAVRRPHRLAARSEGDRGQHVHAQAPPPRRRQGARPRDGALLADHAAAARRQGAIRRAALR